MAELVVIVPTRARPGNVARVIDAWHATGAFAAAWLLVAIDADDPEHPRYAELLAGAGPGTYLHTIPAWRPMVHKLDTVARTVAARYGDVSALGFAGDDHLPRTDGWAQRYLDALAELGTGIVYGDDGYQHENLPTQWAMTADIVRALGRMVPAPVEHLYCDNAIRDLGRAAECLRYLPDVAIEHMHPVVGKASDDAGYRRVNSPEQYRRDRAAYARWMRNSLPGDIATVRRLREETACRRS